MPFILQDGHCIMITGSCLCHIQIIEQCSWWPITLNNNVDRSIFGCTFATSCLNPKVSDQRGVQCLLSILIVRLRLFPIHWIKLPDLPIRQAHIAVAVMSFAVVYLTPKCQPFYCYTNFWRCIFSVCLCEYIGVHFYHAAVICSVVFI